MEFLLIFICKNDIIFWLILWKAVVLPVSIRMDWKLPRIRWRLMLYDAVIFCIYTFFVSCRWGFNPERSFLWCFVFVSVLFLATAVIRVLFSVYSQVWRYGGIQSYIRILLSDFVVFLLVSAVYLIMKFLKAPFLPGGFSMVFIIAVCGINCLLALSMRMFYRYVCKCGTRQDLLVMMYFLVVVRCCLKKKLIF